MKRLPARLAIWLGYAVAVLATAEAVKLLVIYASALERHKDAVASVTSIISSAVLILGAWFAYVRFFHGRTFAKRLEILLDVKVIMAAEPNYLHAIDLGIRNIGTVPIWNPAVVVRVESHGLRSEESEEITNWDLPFGGDRTSVIDSQESSQFYAWRSINRDVWAVTYLVKISTARGEIWTKAVTIPNLPQGDRGTTADKSGR